MGDARALAVQFLLEIFHRQRHLERLHQSPPFLELESHDRRLITELVQGVLRQRALLDFYISELSRVPQERLDEVVLWTLRVGLYQLAFLRIPTAVTVYETAHLCRRFRKASATGFVNALLRQFLRRRPDIPPGNSAAALAVRYSHPKWLVRRYLQRYGETATVRLLERNNERPTHYLWVNPFRTDLSSFCRQLDREQIAYRIFHQLPNCLIMQSAHFSQHHLYPGNAFFMDPASQEIAHLPDLAEKKRLADLCAAPGGKTFLLASRRPETSLMYCCDARWSRLREMKRRAQRYGIPSLHFVLADLTQPAPFRRNFDLVLLDVPCTGLGTLRSNPDLRWKVQSEDLKRFSAKQFEILCRGFEMLVPEGELIYSTCSTEPEENEQVVDQFLDSHPQASLLGDYYRSFPHDHPGECFFVARVRHR